MQNKIRICKYLSENGIASRRAADKMVEEGLITINKRKAILGDMVDPEKDQVYVEGRLIGEKTERKVYIILNKPRGYITSTSDTRGRKTVMELVSGVDVRVYPIGRLDYHSEGLLLFTNDGDFAYELTHPKHTVSKKYEVLIMGEASEKQIDILNKSMTIEGIKLQPAKVVKKKKVANNEVLEFEISEGRNRQIRKMCELAGLFVKRLKRTSIGLLDLEDLKVGKWRYLSSPELELIVRKKQKDIGDDRNDRNSKRQFLRKRHK